MCEEVEEEVSRFLTEWTRWGGDPQRIAQHLPAYANTVLRLQRRAQLGEALRARVVVSALSQVACTFGAQTGQEGQTVLQAALVLLELSMHKRVSRAQAGRQEAGAAEDRLAVQQLVSNGAIIQLLKETVRNSALPPEVRLAAMRVLQEAAYNGTRVAPLLDCVGVATGVLNVVAAQKLCSSLLSLANSAAAFLANVTVGISAGAARRLQDPSAIVRALCSALSMAATSVVAVSAVALRLMINACNALVHLAAAVEQLATETLSSDVGASLCRLTANAPPTSRCKLALPFARLAFILVPDSLTFEGHPSTVEEILGNHASPWYSVFAAAWSASQTSASLEVPLFTPESPVHDAVIWLAVLVETRFVDALSAGGIEEPGLVLLPMRVRLWFGGLVPFGVATSTVSLWTELCFCGLQPEFARLFSDTGSIRSRAFAAECVRKALAAAGMAAIAQQQGGEDGDLDNYANLLFRTAAQLKRAHQLLSAPWFSSLERLANAALAKFDLRFDAALAAEHVVKTLSLSNFCNGQRSSCAWCDDARETSTGSRKCGNVTTRDLDHQPERDDEADGSDGVDDSGADDSGEEGADGDPPRTGIYEIAKRALGQGNFLFHGSLADHALSLAENGADAVATRASLADAKSSDFVPSGWRRFYLCESLRIAIKHAEACANQCCLIEGISEVDVCVVAFRVNRAELFTDYPHPVRDAEGTCTFSCVAEEPEKLTVWRPSICDWEELVTACQSGASRPWRPFIRCQPGRDKKCTCIHHEPLCRRTTAGSEEQRLAFARGPPAFPDGIRTGEDEEDAPDAAAAAAPMQTQCNRCLCSKAILCHQTEEGRKTRPSLEHTLYVTNADRRHPDIIEGPESCARRRGNGQQLRDGTYVHQLVLRSPQAMHRFSSLERVLLFWKWKL